MTQPFGNAEQFATILAMAALGGILAFARDGTFPGRWVPGWLGWLLRQTDEPRWTLQRWAMLATIGVAPAVLVWRAGLFPGVDIIVAGGVWLAMGVAWSTGHKDGQDIGHMHGSKLGDAALMAISGALMGLPVAGVLAVAGHWQCALVALLAGAMKGPCYWLGWQLKPRPGGDPLWATQIGAIGHGVVLFAGLAAAILLR